LPTVQQIALKLSEEYSVSYPVIALAKTWHEMAKRMVVMGTKRATCLRTCTGRVGGEVHSKTKVDQPITAVVLKPLRLRHLPNETTLLQTKVDCPITTKFNHPSGTRLGRAPIQLRSNNLSIGRSYLIPNRGFLGSCSNLDRMLKIALSGGSSQ
jgi:hypothetical protein